MKMFLAFALLFLSACKPLPVVEMVNEPCLVPYQNNDFMLCAAFKLTINNKIFTVPKGFISDLASIPRILWPIYAPNDTKTIGPAILHDYLYACPYNRSRKEIDALFYSALLNNRTSTSTAYFYWLGVRVFGRPHFREGYQCYYGLK